MQYHHHMEYLDWTDGRLAQKHHQDSRVVSLLTKGKKLTKKHAPLGHALSPGGPGEQGMPVRLEFLSAFFVVKFIRTQPQLVKLLHSSIF